MAIVDRVYWTLLVCYFFSLGILWTLALYQIRLVWADCQKQSEQLYRKRDLEMLQGFQPVHPNREVEQWLTTQLELLLQPATVPERHQDQGSNQPWALIRHYQTHDRLVARFADQNEALMRAFELQALIPTAEFLISRDTEGLWSLDKCRRRVAHKGSSRHLPNPPNHKRRQRHGID